jgi:hypothetical protein
VSKSQKRKRFGFPQSAGCAVVGCIATEFDQARLLGMKRESKRPETVMKIGQKRSSVSLMFESCDLVIID